jgi:hypothetical protein
VSPNLLPEVLREKIVDSYPRNDKAAFLNYIDDLVSQLEQDPNKQMRRSRIGASFS